MAEALKKKYADKKQAIEDQKKKEA